MSTSDADFLESHRIPEVLEQLACAILKEKPSDHATFAKTWLQNLRTKMQNNGVSRAHGINLNSISGSRLVKKAVNFLAIDAEVESGLQGEREPLTPVAVAQGDGPPPQADSRTAQRRGPSRKSQKRGAHAAGPSSRWSHVAGSVEGSRRSKSTRALKELVERLDLEDHPVAYKMLLDLKQQRDRKARSAFFTAGPAAASNGEGEGRGGGETHLFMKSVSAASANRAANRGGSRSMFSAPSAAAAAAVGADTAEPANQSTSDRPQRRIAVSSAPIEFAKVAGFKPAEVPKGDGVLATLREVVASTTLFASFESEEREVVIRAMGKEEFASGFSVLTQGEAGRDTFFLIVEGTAEVVKDGKVVATLGPSQFFGELELMYAVPSCAATVRCVTKLVTYTLEKDTYQNMVLHNALARRQTFLAHINKVPFLQTASDYDKMQLADALAVGSFQKDDYLIRWGEANQWMFFLMEGNAKVIGRDGAGKRFEITTVGPGDVVGELEFLFNHNAVADVVVSSAILKVAKLNRKHFEMCMGPITDNLKEYVSRGNYEHYLRQANSSVKAELEQLERLRSAKERVSISGAAPGAIGQPPPGSMSATGSAVARSRNVAIADLEFAELGEVVFGANDSLYRFPLDAANAEGLAIVAITEDGTVVFWNDLMARLTQYNAQHVVNQSVFSFLTQQDDQVRLHDLIKAARKWAGNWEGMCATGNCRREAVSFVMSSGLAKVQLSLSVIPPLVAQPSNRAEVFIIMGHEVKRRNNAATRVDFGKWLVGTLEPRIEQLLAMTRAPEVSREVLVQHLDKALDLARSYEGLANVNSEIATESWLPVDLNVMMNRYITELSAELASRSNRLVVQTTALPAQQVFMDVAKLPDALTYLARNASRTNTGILVRIRVEVLDDEDKLIDLSADGGADSSSGSFSGAKKIRFVVEDDGKGMDLELIKRVVSRRESSSLQQISDLENQSGSNGETLAQPGDVDRKGEGLRRIHQTIAQMGGHFTIERGAACGTACSITLPLLTSKDDDDERSGAGGADATGRGFTTVMVEHSAVHRNMMCQHLWGRRHAVLPATTWREVVRLVDGGNCDILIVDPDYITDAALSETTTSMTEFRDPVEILNKYSKTMAIIMTSESYTVNELPQLEQKGFVALPKPCSAALLHAAIVRAEGIVSKLRLEEERINQLRETFAKTSRGEHKVVRLLGTGAFGQVFEVEDVLTKGRMAMKQLRVKNELMADEMVEEIEAMTKLKHENIIHYFYCEKVDASNLKIYMELAEGGTLQDRVKTFPRGLPLEELVRSLRDVLCGIEYVHAQSFVHRDLKTVNVLLDAEGRGKLGDFGTARQLKPGEKLYVMSGTLNYMAPEVMNADPEAGMGYDYMADVWSFGCIALELATSKAPFSHLPQAGNLGLLRYVSELQETPDLSLLFDKHPAVFELVKACLEPDPARRPTAKQLLNFSLFTEDPAGEDRVAIKLLQRAKLLHALNKFVAFQEPDEDEDAENRPLGAGAASTPHNGNDAQAINMYAAMTRRNFFDSDDDDEEEEEEEEDNEVSMSGETGTSSLGTSQNAKAALFTYKDGRKAYVPAASEEDFFATSSDDDDHDDNGEGVKQQSAACEEEQPKVSAPPLAVSIPLSDPVQAPPYRHHGMTPTAGTRRKATGWATVGALSGTEQFDGAASE